jgi:AraC-like DNA-binding protein
MYRLYSPSPLLSPYIEQYWALRSTGATALDEAIFVDGRADILFNFGVGYLRQKASGEAQTLYATHLDAQRTYPVAIAQTGAIDLLGVRFRAGGLAAFTRIPIHETSDQTIDLAALWGSTPRTLEVQLYDCTDDLGRVALLDSFFLRHLAPTPYAPLLRYVASLIESPLQPRISALSREVGYSIRTLDRLFKAAFGYTPKFYARVARFQRALALVGAPGEVTFAEIAATCGYYDQSHFTHDFNHFAGSAPAVYRALMLARTDDPPPNLVQFFQATDEQMF